MKIQLLHNNQKGKQPQSLSQGELAINTADKIVYTVDDSNNLFEINESVLAYDSNGSGGVVQKKNNNTANGRSALAIGRNNSVEGSDAAAIGLNQVVSGDRSFAIGSANSATSTNSYAIGYNNQSYGGGIGIAIGNSNNVNAVTCTIGTGFQTVSTGEGSFTEGWATTASSFASHAEGYATLANGGRSHAEGSGTTASGNASHAEGRLTIASSQYSHAEGSETMAKGVSSHAEGSKSKVEDVQFTDQMITDDIGYGRINGSKEFTITVASEGVEIGNFRIRNNSANVSGLEVYNIGNGEVYPVGAKASIKIDGSDEYRDIIDTAKNGTYFMYKTIHDSSNYSDCYYYINLSNNAVYEDRYTSSQSGAHAHAEGYDTTAIGLASHAEGYGNEALNYACHAEGENNITKSGVSHVEGTSNEIDGRSRFSHVEGRSNIVSGAPNSHVENWQNKCYGHSSHVGGRYSEVYGAVSFAHGYGVKTNNAYEIGLGNFNLSVVDPDDNGVNFESMASSPSNRTLFSIGNGYSDARHNAFEIKTNGDVYICDPNDIVNVSHHSNAQLCRLWNRYTINLQDLLRRIEVTVRVDSSNQPVSNTDAKTIVDYLEEYPSYYNNITMVVSNNLRIGVSSAIRESSSSLITWRLQGSYVEESSGVTYYELTIQHTNTTYTSFLKVIPVVVSSQY